MASAAAYIHFLLFILALSALIWLIYGPIRELVTDIGRQHLFKTRERLFMQAVRGHVAFQDPNYRIVREDMNRAIQFAHHMSWGRLLIYWLLIPKAMNAVDEVAQANRRLSLSIRNPHAAKAVRLYEKDIGLTMAGILLGRSPLLFLLLLVGATTFILANGIRRAIQRMMSDGLGEGLRLQRARNFVRYSSLALMVSLGTQARAGAEAEYPRSQIEFPAHSAA